MRSNQHNVIIRFFEIAQKLIIVISSVSILTLMLLIVMMRYILKVDLLGLNEVILIFAFWLYFIGAANGSLEKSHISGDMITSFIKKEYLKEMYVVFQYLVITIISIIITYWSFFLLSSGIQKGIVTTVLKIPIIIPYLSIFIGFVLMSAYNIYYFLTSLIKLIKNRKSSYLLKK